MAVRLKREVGLRTAGNLGIVGMCFERGGHILIARYLVVFCQNRGRRCFLPRLEVEGEGLGWEEGSKMGLGACSAGDDHGTEAYGSQWEAQSRGEPLRSMYHQGGAESQRTDG